MAENYCELFDSPCHPGNAAWLVLPPEPEREAPVIESVEITPGGTRVTTYAAQEPRPAPPPSWFACEGDGGHDVMRDDPAWIECDRRHRRAMVEGLADGARREVHPDDDGRLGSQGVEFPVHPACGQEN